MQLAAGAGLCQSGVARRGFELGMLALRYFIAANQTRRYMYSETHTPACQFLRQIMEAYRQPTCANYTTNAAPDWPCPLPMSHSSLPRC